MPLPCTHLRPASRMLHFEESTTMGTREMSGSEAISDRKRTIAASESSSPSSMFTSMSCAPFRTCWRATSSPASKSPSLMSLRKRADPVTLVRSPMLAKSESGPRLSGSSPRGGSGARCPVGGAEGGRPPPRRWLRCGPGWCRSIRPRCSESPRVANSASWAAIDSGVSSYSPSSLGRPALGWQLTRRSARVASSSTCGRRAAAPSAQLRPMASGSACRTEFRNASTVCPERVRPLASTTVPDTMTGTSSPRRSSSERMAKSAALAFRVSKTVSTMSTSTSPSRRPRACSS